MTQRLRDTPPPQRRGARIAGIVLLLAGAAVAAQQFADAMHGCTLCWLGVLGGTAGVAIGTALVLSASGGAAMGRKKKR
jgi:hypothetical protein